MAVQDTSASVWCARSPAPAASSAPLRIGPPPAGAEGLADLGHRRGAGRHPHRHDRAVAGGRRPRLDRRLLLVEAQRHLRDLDQILRQGDAWTDIGFTFRSTIFGFLIGTTCGSLLGLSFWWSRNYAAIVQPYIICFESLPKLALAPLVILVFGIGLASKVAIATALTLVVSTLTTYAGVKAVDTGSAKSCSIRSAPAACRCSASWSCRHCLPWIISVLRVNIGLALTGAIVGEFIASQHGLGRANPLCRPDLRHRAGLGRGAGALDPGRRHVCRGVLARAHAAQRRQAIDEIATAGLTDEVVMTTQTLSADENFWAPRHRPAPPSSRAR